MPRQENVTRLYQNHHLDSTRWDNFVPRDDDIIISTAYKCGTTWTQMISALLIFQTTDLPASPAAMSPWVDHRIAPLDDVLAGLEAQQHRRFIKSHLSGDGQPIYDNAKYIVVGRHPLDVFMSLWNHYSIFTDFAYELFNSAPGRVGPEFPRCPEDIREFWEGWISKGWFDWEPEGYPYWSMLHHLRSWWEYRQLPNVKFIHYNDMLSDLAGEMRSIAAYLDIEIDEDVFPDLVEAATFDTMKARAVEMEKQDPGMAAVFEGGVKNFIFKGTNGRWREVLNEDDLARYDALKTRELTPPQIAWIEAGTSVAGDPRDL